MFDIWLAIANPYFALYRPFFVGLGTPIQKELDKAS